MRYQPRTAFRNATYEIYALRYSTVRNRRACDMFDAPGDDRLLDMALYFWLISNEERVVLLDCGFDRRLGLPGGAQAYDHDPADDRDPVELLAKCGLVTSEIDHVLLSHMHLDHIGNLDLFPRASFSVARAEYEHWTHAIQEGAEVTHAIRPDEVRKMMELRDQGRLELVEGSTEVLPGITVTDVGGHSPGQLITEVGTASGTAVLASDAVHYAEELEHGRPFYIHTDRGGMLRAYDLIRRKTASPQAWLVSGHDPADMERFVRIDDDLVDVASPPKGHAAPATTLSTQEK